MHHKFFQPCSLIVVPLSYIFPQMEDEPVLASKCITRPTRTRPGQAPESGRIPKINKPHNDPRITYHGRSPLYETGSEWIWRQIASVCNFVMRFATRARSLLTPSFRHLPYLIAISTSTRRENGTHQWDIYTCQSQKMSLDLGALSTHRSRVLSTSKIGHN